MIEENLQNEMISPATKRFSVLFILKKIFLVLFLIIFIGLVTPYPQIDIPPFIFKEKVGVLNHYKDPFFVYYRSGFLVDQEYFNFIPIYHRLSEARAKDVYAAEDKLDDSRFLRKSIKMSILQSGIYVISGNNLYYQWKLIEGLNAGTLIFFPSHVVISGNEAFYLKDEKLKKIDIISEPESLYLLCPKYGKDNNYVYFFSQDSVSVVEGADPKTFDCVADAEIEGDQFLWMFGRDDNYVYFRGKRIEGADPKTLGYIDGVYFADSKNIYAIRSDYSVPINSFNYIEGGIFLPIKDADYNTFKIYRGTKTEFDGMGAYDNYNVYFLGEKTGLKPDTIRRVKGQTYYFTDDKNVYCLGKPMLDADAETFVPYKNDSSESFPDARDKNHFYFLCDKVDWVDKNLSDNQLTLLQKEKNKPLLEINEDQEWVIKPLIKLQDLIH